MENFIRFAVVAAAVAVVSAAAVVVVASAVDLHPCQWSRPQLALEL